MECVSDKVCSCSNIRISGRSFGPNFGFPYTFYTFSPPSAQCREKSSQLRETFSPKLPSRMTPGTLSYFFSHRVVFYPSLCDVTDCYKHKVSLCGSKRKHNFFTFTGNSNIPESSSVAWCTLE